MKKRKGAVARIAEQQRQSVRPIGVPRTVRRHEVRGITSLPAGKAVPIAAAGLLREDAVPNGRVRFSFEMHETAEVLMNAVHVNVSAYFVPWLAFERFESMDEFNKSYKGEPYREGEDVTPFFETADIGSHGANEVYVALGRHAKPGTEVNTMYLEAYNLIFNHRATNRSADLELRDRLQTDLAPAFWRHDQFKHIVPDFDQAKIDGEVPLTIANARMPVTGLYKGTQSYNAPGAQGYQTGGTEIETLGGWSAIDGQTGANAFWVEEDPDNPGFPGVFAELQDNGVTVSLANIHLAKKTAAFAKLRAQYAGHSDEWIIDLLMDGISVPEQAYQQPMKVAERSTVFGMSKRYATDAGNLAESAVNGATFVDLDIHMPKMTTGGVLMFIAEITPDQLFERQKDPFFFVADAEELPQYMRDELDPEKVTVVTNDYVDVDHDTPDGVFGYAPLNFQWDRQAPFVGGRFYRPEVDATFDEDRQRIWAVETQNPTLGPDFYLANNIHTKPFADTESDPFEVVAQGMLLITGNTVFGPRLIEASDDYAKVMAKAPTETIDKDAA